MLRISQLLNKNAARFVRTLPVARSVRYVSVNTATWNRKRTSLLKPVITMTTVATATIAMAYNIHHSVYALEPSGNLRGSLEIHTQLLRSIEISRHWRPDLPGYHAK